MMTLKNDRLYATAIELVSDSKFEVDIPSVGLA